MEDLTDREINVLIAERAMGWRRVINDRGSIFFISPEAYATEYFQSRLESGELRDHGGKGDEANVPGYTHSHDAVAEALAKLPEDRQILVGKLLGAGGRLSSKSPQMCCHLVLTATPREKCLAILKALG